MTIPSTGQPLVSIGVPVFNGENYVEQALGSVLAQTMGDFEIVVSDNASTDRTSMICQDLAATDRRIRYYRNERNLGAGANYNLAFHQSRGTYFKWMGDDDRLTPTYVSRCVEVLDDDPTLILVTTQQAHVAPDGAVESAGYDGSRLRSDSAIRALLYTTPNAMLPARSVLKKAKVSTCLAIVSWKF